MLDAIHKTRAYLNYLEQHYVAVQDAWAKVQVVCSDMKFLHNEDICYRIDKAVKEHDASKLTSQEFVPFRRQYYPTNKEKAQLALDPFVNRSKYLEAEALHIQRNNHHAEKWMALCEDRLYSTVSCVHMLCDWIARDVAIDSVPAPEYYQNSEHKSKMPVWADKLILEIFSRVYKEDINES